jgi:hypothetical protein
MAWVPRRDIRSRGGPDAAAVHPTIGIQDAARLVGNEPAHRRSRKKERFRWNNELMVLLPAFYSSAGSTRRRCRAADGIANDGSRSTRPAARSLTRTKTATMPKMAGTDGTLDDVGGVGVGVGGGTKACVCEMDGTPGADVRWVGIIVEQELGLAEPVGDNVVNVTIWASSDPRSSMAGPRLTRSDCAEQEKGTTHSWFWLLISKRRESGCGRFECCVLCGGSCCNRRWLLDVSLLLCWIDCSSFCWLL